MADDRAYRVHIRFNPEGETFVATAPELGLTVSGPNRGEAFDLLEEAIEARVQAAAAGEPLPEPVDLRELSGAVTVQLSPPLHRELLHAARIAGLTPEGLAAEAIARAIGEIEGGRHRDHRPRGPRPAGAPMPDADGNSSAQPQSAEGHRRGGGDRPDPRRGGGGFGPGRQREGYRPDLDDKANFQEYLRNLEKGGGNAGGGRGRGRR